MVYSLMDPLWGTVLVLNPVYLWTTFALFNHRQWEGEPFAQVVLAEFPDLLAAGLKLAGAKNAELLLLLLLFSTVTRNYLFIILSSSFSGYITAG